MEESRFPHWKRIVFPQGLNCYIEDNGGFYQFKFEIDHFFVGDVFDIDGNHNRSFACHVFGE